MSFRGQYGRPTGQSAPPGGTTALTVLLGRLVLTGAGAALARVLPPVSPAREVINYRGRRVSLSAGPTLTLAASLSASAGAAAEGRRRLAAASLVAGLGAGAVGYYDDAVADRAKGLRGHLSALRRGQTTGGVAKLFGVTAAACAASAVLAGRTLADRTAADRRLAGRALADRTVADRRLAGRTLVDVVLGAGVIAGMANLANLLDLRPGRALKVGLALGVPLAASPVGGAVAGPIGAVAALLPADLDEWVMLGDCGANALGAVLGTALAARMGRGGRAALLAGLVALTLASDAVSFSDVIDATPGLRDLDRIGRRP